MKFISHVIETKGVLHSIERSAQIIRRYSFGKKRFSEMMTEIEKDYGGSGVKITFCITASLLNEHSVFIKSFQELGHEFAAHGYIHTNMKKKTRDEQMEIVKRSYRSFEKFDIPVYGFRCPYLSYNRHTIDALASSPFSWVSNNVILWEKMSRNKNAENHMRKLGLLYKFENSEDCMSLPRFIGDLVDIPITAPDDEMIFERCGIKSSEKITGIWLRILSRVHERGELFHLLFHPERFLYVRESIRAVIGEAKRLGQPVWFATLNEITGWRREMKKSGWSAGMMNRKKRRLIINAPPRATVLIKSEGAHRTGRFYKNYMVREPDERGTGWMAFEVECPARHTVMVSPQAPRALEEFLAGEGFLVERAGRPADGVLYIEGHEGFTDADKPGLMDRIDSSPYPLMRIWRWPNGCRSAFTVSSDVDSINVADFLRRLIHF